MKNKMAKNTNLSTIESKKQTEQTRRTQNHGYRHHFDGCQIGRECGGMGEEVRGLRNINK